MKETVYIGLGSNLGDREDCLKKAREGLAEITGVSLIHTSSLFDSAPVGPAQPRYLNASCQIESTLGPLSLLEAIKQLERRLGRTESARWQPRKIDLDILFFGDRIIEGPGLTIPHPELHVRRFVLEPLFELNPHGRHPRLNKTVEQMLAGTMAQDVIKWSSTGWAL